MLNRYHQWLPSLLLSSEWGVKVEVRSDIGLRVCSDHCVDFLKISFRATLWRSDPDFSYSDSVPRPVQAGRISEQFRQTRLPFRIGILHGYLRSARFVSSKCDSTFDLNCLFNQPLYPPNNRRFCSLFRLTFSNF